MGADPLLRRGPAMMGIEDVLDFDRKLSAPSSWERWVDRLFVWMPYVTLALSAVLGQIENQAPGHRIVNGAVTLAAAGWTYVTFTRNGPPLRIRQPWLRLYFVGFLVLAAILVVRHPIFLIYGITGFFHAALLRPWPLAFIGLATTAFVVHSTIVYPDGSGINWSIYLGVVTVQTIAVGAGIYGGEKISELADQRRRALESLELAMEENAGLHAQLVAQAREAGVLDERQRMAREIHDTIAQGLTGVVTQLESAQLSMDDHAELRRRIESASELARHSLAEARRSVHAIRPVALDGSRLPDAVAEVATRWSETNGIHVQVHTTGDTLPLRPAAEIALLRAAQEGLANIAKHASASRAGVTLSFMHDRVTLDVRDDGVGFDADRRPGPDSFGLAAMRQRVGSVHGTMSIESAPGEGTALSVSVPVGSDGGGG